MIDITKLVDKYALVSDQVSKNEVKLILTELNKVLRAGVPGDVVEFGCYKGTTSLFLARLLVEYKSDKCLWLYDSFDGLPDKTVQDDTRLGDEFKRGELKATKAEVLRNFSHANLPRPVIKKGWFNDVTADDVPGQIAFAYYDGDFYESIRDSFAACNGRFAPGAVIVVDDYTNTHLPGAARAVDEWCQLHQSTIKGRILVRDSLAIIELK